MISANNNNNYLIDRHDLSFLLYKIDATIIYYLLYHIIFYFSILLSTNAQLLPSPVNQLKGTEYISNFLNKGK